MTYRNTGRNLNKSMDELFPQNDSDLCRVCNETVVDGRWNYCSVYCREIANAVQSMFIWDSIRERVLERDDYTCQECGLTKEMAKRAYWHTQELIDERADSLDRSIKLDEKYAHLSHQPFEVDHIQRVADGGHKFDPTNLQTLCEDCHEKKTVEENSGRRGPAQDITLSDFIES